MTSETPVHSPVPASRVRDDAERPLWPAVRRGWRRRCPNCGSGEIFRGYLTVRDTCPVCEEELFHQRADDGPAYLTILLVGHLLAPVILIVYAAFRPDPLLMASVLSVITVALSLYLLPRLKGLMIAFQWAKRMHGFGPGPDGAAPEKAPDSAPDSATGNPPPADTPPAS